MAALQRFLQQELPKRGWSVEEFARRASISKSNGYLIIRDGKDNVRQDTFDNIADALNMSPAELAAAIGKSASASDTEEAELLALFRQVPSEHRPAAKQMLRGLRVEPVTKRPEGFGRSNPPGIQQTVHRRKPYESQSVASMIERFGFIPMH